MSSAHPLQEHLAHLEAALAEAGALLAHHARGDRAYRLKGHEDPVTAADHEVDALLRTRLPRAGEGWLSEETLDDPRRLGCRRTWVVDPLDGTRDFVAGRSEYAISVGLVEDGVPVLGGVCNPGAGFTAVGGPGLGIRVQGSPALAWRECAAADVRVLTSRSEWKRGEWRRFERPGLCLLPVGSVAYKMALVAAGLADATWTLVPKNEWDVAGGTALVRAAGGEVWRPDGGELRFNRAHTRFPCLAAALGPAAARVRAELERAT